MKFNQPDNRTALSALRAVAAVTVLALLPLFQYGSAPSWWTERGVLIENATPDDYAPANQGQLKQIAKAAVVEMEAKLPGGAGDELRHLVDNWSVLNPETNDFGPVNLGQLKNVARLFYDRLITAGLVDFYPWLRSPNDPDDFAVANIGQVKNLFAFEIPSQNSLDDPLQDRLAAGEIAGNLALQTNAVWFWESASGQNGGFSIPRRMSGLSGIKSVTAGVSHLAALRNDGAVLTWGKNNRGQLGDGTDVDRDVPAVVPGLVNAQSVKAGSSHTLALQQDGTVLAWGDNSYGQLGTGNTIPSFTPVQVVGLSDVRRIAAGSEKSIALTNDGTVWTWGYNYYSWSTVTIYSSTLPLQVVGLTDVIDVAAGSQHGVAVKADGTVWAWGSNRLNQLGNGSSTNTAQATPTQVLNLNNITRVASSYDHSLALASDGTVWAWGSNNDGQLGDGTYQAHSTPIQVAGLSGVIAIAATYRSSLAMKSDGTVWTWGDGATGTVPNVNLHVPQQVGLGLFDTNHNGMDDRWEVRYFGNLDQSAEADFDGDGITNGPEFLRGTDPGDYYNGAAPVIEIAGGNNQIGDPGAFLAKPFKVRIRNSAGAILANAPVSFAVTDGAGGLSDAIGGAQQQILPLRTDRNGEAAAYHALPDIPGAASWTIATAGKASASSSVNFRGIVRFSFPPTSTPTPTATPPPDPNTSPTPPPNPSATPPPDPNASPTPTPSPTATPVPPYRYAIIDLGKDLYPLRINNKGWVLLEGYDQNGEWTIYRWRGGTLESLAHSIDRTNFHASDINDDGTVVGWEGNSEGYDYSWIDNGVNEIQVGLKWLATSSIPIRVSGPAQPNWNRSKPGTLRAAFLSAISNRNPITNQVDVYGSIHTGDGYRWAWLFDLRNIMNAQRWSKDAAAPVGLSFSTSTADWSGLYPMFDWQGPMDRVTRANASRHYIGRRRTAPMNDGGMIDGQSVPFDPIDLNEAGIAVGSAGADMVVYSSPTSQATISGASPLAINDHVRPAPAPVAGPSATPIPAPQILAWVGNVVAVLELQPDGHTWHPFGLEEMIPSMDGWQYLEPGDMSDTGAIIGQGWYKDPSKPYAPAEYHAFMLGPVELMVDGNRDGEMSFDDPAIRDADRTSEDKPYRFWLNNDHDVLHNVDGQDVEYDDVSDGSQDCEYTNIGNMRDLEDYTRLRINFKGITELIKAVDYSVSLEWCANDGSEILPAADGAPEIVIYQEASADVRPLYLENEEVALGQLRSPNDTWMGRVRGGQPLDLFASRPALRATLSENAPILSLLFCGRKAGKGQLILTVKKGPNIIGRSAPLHVELLDIKDMYERWSVGDSPGADPEVLPLLSDRSLPTGYSGSGHVRPFEYRTDDPEEKMYVLYVHGWNVTPQEKDQFAETAYKRMFWQGYTGRFGVFQWPTTYGFGALLPDDTKWKNGVNGIYSAVSDPTNYDRGEWSAWRSGLALKRLLVRLNHSYTGNVYMFAHSMGNIVAGEALRMASQERLGYLVNTYVASQAAVPVHCYAGNQDAPLEAEVPAESILRMLDGGYPETPNIYADWLTPNASSASRRINFFNQNDYALWNDVWQLNQYFKPDRLDPPDLLWTYRYVEQSSAADVSEGFRKDYYDPRNAGQDIRLRLGDPADVKDRYEIMSFAAESRSKALGGTPNVNNLSDNIDLQTVWPTDANGGERPYSSHKWHSAEFRSTNMRQRKYWQTMLGPRGFNVVPEHP